MKQISTEPSNFYKKIHPLLFFVVGSIQIIHIIYWKGFDYYSLSIGAIFSLISLFIYKHHNKNIDEVWLDHKTIILKKGNIEDLIDVSDIDDHGVFTSKEHKDYIVVLYLLKQTKFGDRIQFTTNKTSLTIIEKLNLNCS